MTLALCMPWQNAESDPAWYGRALDMLQPASWYDHQYHQTADPHYVPMLYGLRDDAYMFEAIRVARGNKRRMWLLGNEPERQDQSDTEPSEAADAVALWKQRTDNPIAAPGILWDASGQRWIEDYLGANGPMPEFWAIHIYAHTAGHWMVLWREWREWMSWNGVELPTVVSECASWSESVDDQRNVMDAVRQTLRTDSMLHSAYWFSASYGPFVPFWGRSDLLTADGALTALGDYYVAGGVAPAAGYTAYLPQIKKTPAG